MVPHCQLKWEIPITIPVTHKLDSMSWTPHKHNLTYGIPYDLIIPVIIIKREYERCWSADPLGR